MTGSSQSSRHRRTLGSLLAAGAVGALLLAGATACASTSKSVAVSSGSSSAGSAPATGASPSASPSGSATKGGGTAGTGSAGAPISAGSTPTGQPVIPGGGIVVKPNSQLASIPAGTKFVQFSTAEYSSDGRTLYLGIESQGGACGQYDVVLQQSSGSVGVGLIHLPAGSRICPMYVAHMSVSATLSAPLGGRHIIDLASGQTVAAGQVG